MGSVLGNPREKQTYDWYRLCMYIYICIYIIHCDGSIHVSLPNVLKHLCNMMKFLKEMLLMFGFLVASSPTYIWCFVHPRDAKSTRSTKQWIFFRFLLAMMLKFNNLLLFSSSCCSEKHVFFETTQSFWIVAIVKITIFTMGNPLDAIIRFNNRSTSNQPVHLNTWTPTVKITLR